MANKVDDWKRDELFKLFSMRTNRKDDENYILNAIWQKIDNLNLQPVTQQCIILKDGKRALIDLYFPQLNYGIECDEEYHKNNTFEDLKRTEKIEDALSAIEIDKGFVLKRIPSTNSLDQINKDISNIVKDIKKRIKSLNEPLKWESVPERIEAIIKRGVLRDSDLLPFPNHASTAPCFNKNAKLWLKSYFALNEDYQLWFPKWALEKGGKKIPASKTGWVNTLSNDWSTIIEYNVYKNKRSFDKNHKKPRIVFAESKDVFGEKAYRFIGVFQYEGVDAKKRYSYKKIAKEIDLTQFFK